jgi:hypothetical protein
MSIHRHNIPLEHYFWRWSLSQLTDQIEAENSTLKLTHTMRWIKSIKAIEEDWHGGRINYSTVVLTMKDREVAQNIVKHGIRLAGREHRGEEFFRDGLDSQCTLCHRWGHTLNKCDQTLPTCAICAECHITAAHLGNVGGCTARRHEIFKCFKCSGAHPAFASTYPQG